MSKKEQILSLIEGNKLREALNVFKGYVNRELGAWYIFQYEQAFSMFENGKIKFNEFSVVCNRIVLGVFDEMNK